MTEEQARYEFDNLRSDDDTLILNGVTTTMRHKKNSFFEWCSLYDDLKHIKQKEVA
jgi:hypothetical protein